ncbi:hypothetical protein ACIP6T_24475 [Pantoea sp. NPDC088449]|uniref:hypothetical protein n=1 Tax=Pantoea sp. NPDC088449 TaxID=3364392 RepID=UPI00380B5962
MEIINDVANSFFNSILIEINEDFHFCEAVYKITDTALFSDFNERAIRADEQLSLYHLDYDVFITLDQSEAVSYGQSPDCVLISEQLYDRLKFLEDDENYIKIKVYKGRAHRETNCTHIFNFNNYISNPLQRPDIEFVNFLKNFNINSPLRFNVWEKIYEFQTPLMNFLNVNSKFDSAAFSCERNAIIEKRNKSCHFTNDSDYKFIPDDFYVKDVCLYPQVKNKLNRLLVIFTLVYLSDYSEITNSDSSYLDYKFKGYRLISHKVGLNSVSTTNAEELYQIYEWVYSQGSFVDKMGLARNIISIHMTGNDVATLASGTLRSIQSGYDIYLKDNVKQYIEIKNKISELLISQADKAADITKNMFGSLKTSLWSIVTFFITVVLIKVVAAKGNGEVVSGDILSITAVFVIFSFVYLWLSLREVKDEKERLFSRYENIKSRYKDLLNDDDLVKVIDTLALKTQDGDFIDTRKKQYRNIWVGFNILTILTVGIMYWNGKTPQTSEIHSPTISKTEETPHIDAPISSIHKNEHSANNNNNSNDDKKSP